MVEKLKSRKFLIALGSMIFSAVSIQLGAPQWVVESVLKIAMLYIGVEGGIDALAVNKKPLLIP